MSDLVPSASRVAVEHRPAFTVGRPIITINVDDAKLHISTEHITWFVERPDKLVVHFAGGSNLEISPTRETRTQLAAVVKLLRAVLDGQNPIREPLR